MTDIVERLRKAYPRLAGYQRHVGEEAADEIEQLRDEIERLRAAAVPVCWFDWSANDDDAVAAIEELRRALEPKPLR